MGQARNVDAASGYVGRHEHARLLAAEAGEDFFALRLRNVAVQGGDLVAALVQKARHRVGVVLGLREHKPVKVFRHVDEAHQRFNLFALAHHPVALVD